MKILSQLSRFAIPLALLVVTANLSTLAQDGKLIIHANPRQAYVFVDGRAMGEASKVHSVSLSAGDHKIILANYGYNEENRTVTITAGKNIDLDVTPLLSG